MKKNIFLIIIIVSLLSACNPVEQSESESATIASEHRCGDKICDGPENIKNCPDDCDGNNSITMENSEPNNLSSEDEDILEPGQENNTTASDLIGEIFIEITVTRQDGVGTCGEAPWGVDHISGGDQSCHPPKYWYGYELTATAQQQVNILPQGLGWIFTPRSSGGGAYQQAAAWSDGNRVCEPKQIQADPFDFAVTGASADGEIVLGITSNPKEIASWVCDGGNTYERETTLLLIDWGSAINGTYNDISVLFTESDRASESQYHKIFEANTNPSPEDRDHVTVDISFTCMQENQDGSTLTASPCPW